MALATWPQKGGREMGINLEAVEFFEFLIDDSPITKGERSKLTFTMQGGRQFEISGKAAMDLYAAISANIVKAG